MIRVLAVGFGPYPGCLANPSQEIVETLRAERWSPESGSPGEGCRLTTMVAPALWWRSVDAVLTLARREDPDAIVLIGHGPGGETLQCATAAINVAGVQPDAAGLHWPGRSIAPGAAERLDASLPARVMARMMSAGGAPAIDVADGGDFIWNRCFYEVLAQQAARQVGLILAPTPLETARRIGRDGPATLNRSQLLAGAQAAIRWAATVAARAKAAA